MKIVFLPHNIVSFTAQTLNERPLGGTETGIIKLAEVLNELGAHVRVLTQDKNPPLSSPLYLPVHAINDLGQVDAFIAVRDWQALFVPIQAKKKFFWTGDSYDQPVGIGLGDKRVANSIDAFLTVSDWHADTFCKASGFPRSKAWTLRNGFDHKNFLGTEERAMQRLIYSSMPYRGLRFLPQIFSELKLKHPALELHVFSGFDVYASSQPQHEPAVREFAQISEQLKALPGCVLHGNVKQDALAREFMRSTILAYPNTFEETSCITAIEAQAAGCPIVTSAIGALPETVGEAGILIPGVPGTPEYIEAFIAATDKLLTDSALWKSYSAKALERATQMSWQKVGARFFSYLKEGHGL